MDGALRSSMVVLAAVMVWIGVWTESWKKVCVTYFLGMALIGGVLLPDWTFFDREVSRWCSPVTIEERAASLDRRSRSKRFNLHPLRLLAYTVIYGFALHKWWSFVSN